MRRGAIAEEDGTVVLVVGGTPGKAYEVSAWEAAGDAYPLWEDGKHEEAREILARSPRSTPTPGSCSTTSPASRPLLGEPEPALDHLRRSIELEERFREFARTDQDFDADARRPEFRELCGGRMTDGYSIASLDEIEIAQTRRRRALGRASAATSASRASASTPGRPRSR